MIITEDCSDLSDYAHILPTRLPALVFTVKSSKHDDSGAGFKYVSGQNEMCGLKKSEQILNA